MKKTLAIVILTFLFQSIFAQIAPKKPAISVFLDGDFIDMQYIRNRLVVVDYVRDFRDADVYIRSIRQHAGNGGDNYTLIFDGQKRFYGRHDTIQFTTLPNVSFDTKRQLMLNYLFAGLMPYIAASQVFTSFNLSSLLPEQKLEDNSQQVIHDKWHNWVFTLGLNGSYRAESSYKSLNTSAAFHASKVTQDWIIEFNSYYGYSKTDFFINNDYTVSSQREDYAISSLIVRAINDHWSWGGKAGFGHSTYRNFQQYFRLKPAIEYNLFPYSQATVRQMRFLYQIGIEQNYYIDTTIYNKLQELLYRQDLAIAYQVRKKWGTINLSLKGGTYLHDLSKNSLRFSTYLNLRLIKGLAFRLSGSLGLVHDQLYLPKGQATLEEILTRQQQLATQYTYNASIGLTYTFGSIYNNIVNPRFGRS